MIFTKTKKEVEYSRVAAKTVGKILKKLKETTKIGENGLILNERANKIIFENNCEPNFLNYNGFPASICVSVNEQLVHGIPNDKPFEDGDLISVDVGCKYMGMNADAAVSFIVGKETEEKKKILNTTKKCLDKAIEIIKENVSLKKIGYIIERIARKEGYKLTVGYAGHGIGKNLHEEPFIFNIESKNLDIKLPVNSIICVEPMLLIGSYETEVLDDGWTVVSKNRKITCHFEHMLLVTKNGVDILTNYEKR